MLEGSHNIGQSQALVVFVDKGTWTSANKDADTCGALNNRMNGIDLLFVEIGTFEVGNSDNSVGNCFSTATRLPQLSYSTLTVTDEDNEALCGADVLAAYFG